LGDASAESLLAVLRFGGAGDALPLPVIGETALECWLAQSPAQGSIQHGFACRDDGQHLFFRYRDTDSRDIEAVGERAYTQLRRLLAESGYPEPLRLWTYFDGLTVGEGDDERYRRFCQGRYHAIAAPGFERSLPAATVIGTRVPGFHFYGLASRTPGVQIENPRQVSAFRYPREYGPRSPSFSRATRYGDVLLMSGTAAIVGHETQHAYNTAAQADEMLANVDALLIEAGGRWIPDALKLYVHDTDDAAVATTAVRRRFGQDAPLLVLQGEVCRRGLMVEIEGVFRRS
jgi:chorismate lyase/3-hydroxybenzoate synthase